MAKIHLVNKIKKNTYTYTPSHTYEQQENAEANTPQQNNFNKYLNIKETKKKKTNI